MAPLRAPSSPPGLERRILRRLPWAALGGTLVAALFSISAHWHSGDGSAADIEKHVRLMDAVALGAVFVWWTLTVTVAIGCAVVIVMKGPVHEADSYPVPDRDRPES